MKNRKKDCIHVPPYLAKRPHFVLNLTTLYSTYDIHRENGLGKIVKCKSKTENCTTGIDFCSEYTMCLIENLHLINVTILFFLLCFITFVLLTLCMTIMVYHRLRLIFNTLVLNNESLFFLVEVKPDRSSAETDIFCHVATNITFCEINVAFNAV